MVYSTCSMNPVENEAVVAEVASHFWERAQFLKPKIFLDDILNIYPLFCFWNYHFDFQVAGFIVL